MVTPGRFFSILIRIWWDSLWAELSPLLPCRHTSDVSFELLQNFAEFSRKIRRDGRGCSAEHVHWDCRFSVSLPVCHSLKCCTKNFVVTTSANINSRDTTDGWDVMKFHGKSDHWKTSESPMSSFMHSFHSVALFGWEIYRTFILIWRVSVWRREW